VARFGRELDAGTYKAAADAQAAEGARIGVQATPSFFVNGRFHEGAEPLERLEADFAEASKEADALVAKGTPRGKLYDALMKTALAELPKPALLEPEAHAVDPGPKAPSRGAARAPVTIVEFSDFQCPYCKRAADLLATVRSKYGDRVRIVFRNFPLPYHNQAELAAEAALAAGAQGKFWEMHDQLFAHQGGLDRGVIDGLARTLGLDVARFDAALDGKRFAAAIDADKAAGGALVDGTPTLFVNGHKLSNPGLLAEAVAEELGRKN
jgi:protein-disulfide isomerase